MHLATFFRLTILFGALILECLNSQAKAADTKDCPFGEKVHLNYTPVQKIHAELSFVMRPMDNSKVSEWTVYANKLPALETQRECNSRMFVNLKQSGKEINAQETFEDSSTHRRVFRIHMKQKQFAEQMTVSADYDAVLYKVELAANKNGLAKVKLSPKERNENLTSTFSLDFSDSQFQEFLKTNDLIKGKMETDICFAWRVFCSLKKQYKYYWTQSLDRRASITCRNRATDCGGLSYLFCSVLRANEIPARPLIGRWASSDDKEEDFNSSYKCHVKSEFFIDDVGWIPADLSEAVSYKKTNPSRFFGTANGDFIVMHTNPDLILDSLFDGKKNIRSNPDFRVWALTDAGDKTAGSKIPRRIRWNVTSKTIVK